MAEYENFCGKEKIEKNIFLNELFGKLNIKFKIFEKNKEEY